MKKYKVKLEVILELEIEDGVDPVDFLNEMEYSFNPGTETEGSIPDYTIQDFEFF